MEYEIVPEVEDIVLSSEFGEKTKEILSKGSIDERVALCEVARILQKKNEQKFSKFGGKF